MCIIPRPAHGVNPDSAVMPHISMKIKWIDDDSQGVPPEELRKIRQETEDVKENKPKGLIIVDIELVAVKSHKSPGSSGWTGWQSIVMETEYGDAWVGKADENSQRLETYDAMRKTTESEREAKDQITEHINNKARKRGRRYREQNENLSKIESVESKVENEMLSVKMRLTKAICWNQAKFGDDAAEKFVLEPSSKSFPTYETLKMRKKVHQVKEGCEVLEKLQELVKENGRDDTELRDFAASATGRRDYGDSAARSSPTTSCCGGKEKRLPKVVWQSAMKP